MRFALAMLAVRWHGEIVAEKGSIINAAITSALYLDSTLRQLAGVAVIFFLVEVATDGIFVYVMHEFFEVPMLSAIPHADLLSMDNIKTGVMTGLMFTSISGCVFLAANAPLK